MISARYLNLVTKLGLAVFVLGAFASSGRAQNAYQGKFTLPVETHWGIATLPAGDYTFTLASNSAPYRLYIRGQRVSAIIQATAANQKVRSGHAQLNLVGIADVSTVQTFEAPDLGVTFTYWMPSQKHMGAKEAQHKATTPATQVSENKTSIEVQTTGR
jgi:hypothetical protein